MRPQTGALQLAGLAAVEAALNRIIALDPAAPALLAPLREQVFHFAVHDLKLDLFMLPSGAGVRLTTYWEGPVTAALQGDSRDFLALLRAEDAAAELINSDLVLRGDSRALTQLQAALAQLEPDWEAPIARLMGDVAAHSLGRGIRGGMHWLRSAGAALVRQHNDYWREESAQLVPQEAWQGFAAEVDQCRQASDRLAARLARLRQQRRVPGSTMQ